MQSLIYLFKGFLKKEKKTQNDASVSFLSARVRSDMTASWSGGRRFGKGR